MAGIAPVTVVDAATAPSTTICKLSLAPSSRIEMSCAAPSLIVTPEVRRSTGPESGQSRTRSSPLPSTPTVMLLWMRATSPQLSPGLSACRVIDISKESAPKNRANASLGIPTATPRAPRSTALAPSIATEARSVPSSGVCAP